MNYEEHLVDGLKNKDVPSWIIDNITAVWATPERYMFVTLNAEQHTHLIDNSLNSHISEIEQTGLLLFDMKTAVNVRYDNVGIPFPGVHNHSQSHEYYTPLELLRLDINPWLSKIAYAIMCSSVSNVFVVLDDERRWVKVSNGPLVLTSTSSTQRSINELLKMCSSMRSNQVLNQMIVLAKEIEDARKSIRVAARKKQ